MHDEISTLQLELGQLEDRNESLKKDNAKLLQRWLDAKQAEANRMNQANEFYEDMRNRHQAVMNWRGDATSSNAGANRLDDNDNLDVMSLSQSSIVSGNGEPNGEGTTHLVKDGTKSQQDHGTNLNPNG